MIGGITITPFDAAAILIVLAAVLGYINQRLIGLSSSIGLTVMGALAVIGLSRLLLGVTVSADIVRFLRAIYFHATLMDGML
jgi:CPA1 family monovalent cation:H+ antiporter